MVAGMKRALILSCIALGLLGLLLVSCDTYSVDPGTQRDLALTAAQHWDQASRDTQIAKANQDYEQAMASTQAAAQATNAEIAQIAALQATEESNRSTESAAAAMTANAATAEVEQTDRAITRAANQAVFDRQSTLDMATIQAVQTAAVLDAHERELKNARLELQNRALAVGKLLIWGIGILLMVWIVVRGVLWLLRRRHTYQRSDVVDVDGTYYQPGLSNEPVVQILPNGGGRAHPISREDVQERTTIRAQSVELVRAMPPTASRRRS